MAYVQPNSTIEFFSDINLSDKYTDSLYFASVSAKDTYFTNLNKVARVLTCSYTRENRGYVRVEVPMATLIGATYMRFKNTSFENKWFYAFVDKVDYVNNQTTEVKFSIDPLMTWMGTFTLNECYIERQHTLNDGIGNNIAEEGIPVGDYVIENQHTVFSGTSKIMVVCLTNNVATEGSLVGGIYSAYSITVCNSYAEVNALIDGLVSQNKFENIVGIYMCPEEIAVAASGRGGVPAEYAKPYASLNGYVPRNKKLFCYPYKYAMVDNSEGAQQEYKYEFFNTLPDATSSGNYSFDVLWCRNASVDIFIEPINYKCSIRNNPIERLGMSHYPPCAVSVDSYNAYLAQRNAYLDLDVAKAQFGGVWSGATKGFASGSMVGGGLTPTGILGGIGGAALGAAVGGGVATYKTVKENMIENEIRPSSPAISRGSQGIDALFSWGQKNLYINEMCITKNYAMMIDSYFDMFGYAVKQHGVPNMNARPNWTYVKTIGCNVGGAIPADDASAIESIFDNGIRFWKNHNNIGNYSLNNAPA